MSNLKEQAIINILIKEFGINEIDYNAKVNEEKELIEVAKKIIEALEMI